MTKLTWIKTSEATWQTEEQRDNVPDFQLTRFSDVEGKPAFRLKMGSSVGATWFERMNEAKKYAASI